MKDLEKYYELEKSIVDLTNQIKVEKDKLKNLKVERDVVLSSILIQIS